MRDPIKENINEKTGKVTYEFSINLGVPPGEDKPFRTRRRGFTTKKAARSAYMLMKARAAQGIFPEREKSNSQTVKKSVNAHNEYNANSTVAEYFSIYWEAYRAKGNESTTNDKTFNCFKNHILPHFGETQLKNITPLLCREFAEPLSKKLPSSSRQVLIYLKAMLQDAVNMNVLEKNAMEHVKILTNNEIIRKKKIAGEEDVFFSNYYNIEELMEFLSFTKKHCNQKIHTFFLLLAHSGLRRGEAFALRWSDINFNKKTISVNKSVAYSTEKKLHLKSTKNHESRKVPMDQDTMDELKNWKVTQQKKLSYNNKYIKADNDQFIFENQYNELYNPSTASRWLKSIYSANNLRPITAHGFRHTHCTLALQSRQFTVPEIMHRLGHKDVQVTMQVYTHVTEDTMENNTDLYLDYLKANSSSFSSSSFK